ncbi:hypothetical protein DPV86_02560 [Haemophilus parahaemolyticus]|uniref:phage tail-collar fiber domain-containing protein n=1 Tax=Haemophilus parahaemolyticus TaxID=735 RepID=UPI000DADDF1F|nr:phage tail protein [Haemophilus parahaemolyticus]RDE82810.1 hypothetical protein DPV86_02560 [Haemophilus parahaemolyticus]
MASTRATNALKSYIAKSVARNETVTFDKIIFAHISGLNDATLANINNMPTVDQIKHTANIQQTGYIADDQVVYSVTLGSEIGDFTFNFVGLVNSVKNVLGVAIYTGDIVKTRTKEEEQGNALTRNIILQVNNAKTLTNIQTQAKAWQFDFTDKFLQMKPKKITASTTNAADSSGHTHEIEKASTTQSGIVQLVDDWTTHDNRKTLTASVGKRLYDTLKGLIDSVSGRTTTAQNTAANALSKTTPKKITASTTNVADQNGHTHEIEKASTSIAGVVKLNDSLTSNATDEALTARQGKVLDEKIDNLSKQAKEDATRTIREWKSTTINQGGRQIAVDGYLVKKPDGTMIQTFHVHKFEPYWFRGSVEGVEDGRSEINDGWSVPLALWQRMENCLSVIPQINTYSFAFSAEAGEHLCVWAKRATTPEKIVIEGHHFTGNAGGLVDLVVVVEGWE